MKNKFISKSFKEISSREFILYIIFGLFSAGIDFTIFYLLFNYKNLEVVFATVISTFCGYMISFLLNSFINFKRTNHAFVRFIKFATIGTTGIALSAVIITIGVDNLGIDGNFMKIISIIIIGTLQYLLNSRITFK
jgi:putative flippase GtrA